MTVVLNSHMSHNFGLINSKAYYEVVGCYGSGLNN